MLKNNIGIPSPILSFFMIEFTPYNTDGIVRIIWGIKI